jgi:hypothetical protein
MATPNFAKRTLSLVAVALTVTVSSLTSAAPAPAAPGVAPKNAAPESPNNDWMMHASVGADLGVGAVITRYSPEASDGGTVLYTAIRGGYEIREDLQLKVALQLWALPGANFATGPSLGIRFEPYQAPFGRGFLDGSLGVAWTNAAANVSFDIGAGFELDLPTVPGVALGPVFRYGQVVDPAPRTNDDGRAWQLGVSATYHFGRAAAGRKSGAATGPVRPFVFNVPDSDHDGVTDDVDECPQVPAGRRRDPIRRGCPENDEDQDGITDSDDLCPLTPAGDHPDPARKGCPFADSDGDGIADADDHCPYKSGPASTDPTRNGCPERPKKASRRTKKRQPASGAESLPAPTVTPKRSMTPPAQSR